MASAVTCLGLLTLAPGDWSSLFCTTSQTCLRELPTLEDYVRYLALAVLIGISFYAFMIRAPVHYRQWRLKTHLTRQCRAFKEKLVAEMVGIATGSVNSDVCASLVEPAHFRAFFSTELSAGRTRWHAFQKNVDQNAINQILFAMTSLRNEITFVVNNVSIQGYAPFEFRKRLTVTLDAIESNLESTEKTRLLADYLWGVFAGRHALYDVSEEDLLQRTLTAIVSDPAVPFSLLWWRKADRKEPLSAYESLF